MTKGSGATVSAWDAPRGAMIDPRLLETFVAVAETLSFTTAAVQLDLSQSTVSAQIRRLETGLGRNVLSRSTHGVALTPDGDMLLGLARDALRSRTLLAHFASGLGLRERVRFGVCDDFSMSGLPRVLERFARTHGEADLELTIGLSIPLYERYDAGLLDVILVKRRPNDGRGSLAWRDRLVWAGAPGLSPDPAVPLPLLLFPSPSITRGLALQALEREGRSWRLACTSDSLSGLHASALAGLGVLPHAQTLVPASLQVLDDASLPEMERAEFVVLTAGGHPGRKALAAALLADVALLQGAPPDR